MLFGRNEDDPTPGLEWDRDGPWRDHAGRSDRTTVDYDGETYVCRHATSADGDWSIAYGTPGRDGQSRGFLFREGSLEWTIPLEHPTLGLVADDGTVLILEGGAADRLNGTVRCFDSAGESRFVQEFDANVSDVDLSADGRIAVVRTKSPDETTYLIDVPDGSVRLTHTSKWASPSHARLYSSDRGWLVYLSQSLEKKPLYAIDLDGDLVWEGRSYRQMKPLSARLKTRLS